MPISQDRMVALITAAREFKRSYDAFFDHMHMLTADFPELQSEVGRFYRGLQPEGELFAVIEREYKHFQFAYSRNKYNARRMREKYRGPNAIPQSERQETPFARPQPQQSVPTRKSLGGKEEIVKPVATPLSQATQEKLADEATRNLLDKTARDMDNAKLQKARDEHKERWKEAEARVAERTKTIRSKDGAEMSLPESPLDDPTLPTEGEGIL